ncbi:mannosyltransferase putative-domain-containing protein [Kockovaella imperatae]|uniref:Mannosyltransferase putative-domain-containing protein n=1 Tax=Kockovaella imperatae TaxID=4999 RepID=A0A1Y1UAD2_9TREE|nr:mannosyltransferase putative-domain-containing protein [Kockovaella imperatae]ORX34456.1 mannosyltransferase putative-domain-containing protein [Kockovaella imperatae]
MAPRASSWPTHKKTKSNMRSNEWDEWDDMSGIEMGKEMGRSTLRRRPWVPLRGGSTMSSANVLRKAGWIIFGLVLTLLLLLPTSRDLDAYRVSRKLYSDYPESEDSRMPNIIIDFSISETGGTADNSWPAEEGASKTNDPQDLPPSNELVTFVSQVEPTGHSKSSYSDSEDRLRAWLQAPGSRSEAELDRYKVWNLEQCGAIELQEKPMSGSRRPRELEHTVVEQRRKQLIDHIDDAYGEGLVEMSGSGRGIIMVASDEHDIGRAKQIVELLRDHSSSLSVEIWCSDLDRPDSEDPIHQQLRELDAIILPIQGSKKIAGRDRSHVIKAAAIIQSKWQEVLYLDLTSVPVRDPEYMFEAPNYKRLGFWAGPRQWKTSASNPIWSVIGEQCRNEWEMDTSQFFIDKSKHMDTIVLAEAMLEHDDFLKLGQWAQFSDDPTDAMRWALLALRKPWAVPGRWIGVVSAKPEIESGASCGITTLQYDSWGQPLFLRLDAGFNGDLSAARTRQVPLRMDELLGDVDSDMLLDVDDFRRGRALGNDATKSASVGELNVGVMRDANEKCFDLILLNSPIANQEISANRDSMVDDAEEIDDEASGSWRSMSGSTSFEYLQTEEWDDDMFLKGLSKKLRDTGF